MLGTLLASFATVETGLVVQRLKRAMLAYGLAAIFGVTGLGFAVGAGFSWIAARYGTVSAALGFAAGFFVLAALILLIHRVAAGVRERRREKKRSVDVRTLASAAAVTLLPLMMRRGGRGALLFLPLAGIAAMFIAGRRAGDDEMVD